MPIAYHRTKKNAIGYSFAHAAQTGQGGIALKNRKRKFTLPPLFLPPEGGLAGNIRVDPQGSYTGVVPEQPEEEPVQDADDL